MGLKNELLRSTRHPCEAQHAWLGMSDDEGCGFPHQLLKGRLVFEGSPQFTVAEHARDPPGDTTAKENAASGAEDEGQIAREAPQERREKTGRLGRGSFLATDCFRDHIGRLLAGRRGANPARDRAIEANQTRPGQHGFSRDPATRTVDERPGCKLFHLARSEIDVARLGGMKPVALSNRNTGSNT